MSISKKQLFWVVFILAAAAGVWGVYQSDQSQSVETELAVESIDWDENEVRDQSGNVLLSAEDVPGSVAVSEEAEFGVAGPFTGVELSPDKSWIALTMSGAAHGSGWLYDIGDEELIPVAFQYGGGVEILEWSPDSQFMAFRIGTPAATEHILAVDRDNTDEEYVSEVGQQVEVNQQADLGPPFAYEFIRWESPRTLCFSFDGGDEVCRPAEDVNDGVDASDDEPSTSREVSLYFYNPDDDTDEQGNIMCSAAGLTAVERTITEVQTPLTATMELLLAGELTEEEESQGITTEFPLSGFSLEGINLEDGVATLEFSDPEHSSSGGSCRAGILYAQIEATATQFPQVDEVQIIPEDILQP